MNVTLKLPDEMCKEARHYAVDESKSLSAWVSALMEKELQRRNALKERPKTWMEAMETEDMPEWFYEKEFPLEDRKAMKVREFNFED